MVSWVKSFGWILLAVANIVILLVLVRFFHREKSDKELEKQIEKLKERAKKRDTNIKESEKDATNIKNGIDERRKKADDIVFRK